MLIDIGDENAEILCGECAAVRCLICGNQIKMRVLRLLELLQQTVGGFRNQILKQRRLIRIVAVKCPFGKARLRNDMIKRSVLETFGQEFLFPNFPNPLLRSCVFHSGPPPIY